MDAYVFDIDGTLSIVGSRLACLTASPPDWDAFYARCGEDAPNRRIVALCAHLMDHFDVVLLTGRRESVRSETLHWLGAHGLGKHARLLMRPEGDRRPDTVVKPELLAASGVVPAVIFEDRASMVDCWRSRGLVCLQVAPGDF